VVTRASHTPAHDSVAAVAPFRAWRGSQLHVARGPTRVTIVCWFNSGCGLSTIAFNQSRKDREVLSICPWTDAF